MIFCASLRLHNQHRLSSLCHPFQEADGAVASFTVNLARSTVIDYTHPYFEEPAGILIPPPTSGDTMASFLTPFSWQVVACINARTHSHPLNCTLLHLCSISVQYKAKKK